MLPLKGENKLVRNGEAPVTTSVTPDNADMLHVKSETECKAICEPLCGEGTQISKESDCKKVKNLGRLFSSPFPPRSRGSSGRGHCSRSPSSCWASRPSSGTIFLSPPPPPSPPPPRLGQGCSPDGRQISVLFSPGLDRLFIIILSLARILLHCLSHSIVLIYGFFLKVASDFTRNGQGQTDTRND